MMRMPIKMEVRSLFDRRVEGSAVASGDVELLLSSARFPVSLAFPSRGAVSVAVLDTPCSVSCAIVLSMTSIAGVQVCREVAMPTLGWEKIDRTNNKQNNKILRGGRHENKPEGLS